MNDLDLEQRLRRTCDAVADRTVITPHHEALRQTSGIDLTRDLGRDGSMRATSAEISGSDLAGGRRPHRPATRGWRTTVVGIAATLLILAGGVALMRLGRDGEATTRADEGSGGRWEELPASPVAAFGGGQLWTGTELIQFGGYLDRPMTDAIAYDPARRSWRQLADLPADLAGASIGAWTGHEIVALATDAPGKAGIYDPEMDQWRVVTDPAIPTVHVESYAFWTGDKVLLAGVEWSQPTHNDLGRGAALYDPSTGEWQVLPEAPQPLGPSGGAVWTGREMIFVGQLAREPDDPGPGSLVALALDPAARQWRVLPAPPLSERGDPAVVWTGAELLVAGGTTWPDPQDPESGVGARDAVVFDMATETWAPYPELPVGVGGNDIAASPTVAIIGRQVVFTTTDAPDARPLVLDTATRTWQLGAPPPGSLPRISFSTAVPADGEVLVRAWGDGESPERHDTTFSYIPPG